MSEVEQELPDGWEVSTLAEVCSKITDGSHNPPKKQETGLPMLSAINISNNRINFDHYRLITPEAFALEDQRTQVAAGDVLVTIVGSIGRCAIVPAENQKFTLQRSVAVLMPIEVEPSFLMHQIESSSPQKYLRENAKGTAQKGVYLRTLSAMPLCVAPLNEQRRIVEKIETLFARLDKGEEAVRQVQKLLSRYRQSVLKAAVTGELVKSDRADWQTVKLGSLLTDIRYGTAKKCGYDAATTAVLRIPNVVGGNIDLEDLKYTDLSESEMDKLALKSGDVLIVRSNGSANLVARGAVVNEAAAGMAFAGYLIRLRLNADRILPEYLHLHLNAPQTRASIERQAKSTSGVHNINSGEVKAISIELPPIPEQKELISVVDEAFQKIVDLERWCETELKRSAALRQSILKDAFAGKLVPQDPDDEPASELLARIAAGKKTSGARPRHKLKELG